MGENVVFGLEFHLRNFFEKESVKIESRMRGLANQSESIASKISNSFSAISIAQDFGTAVYDSIKKGIEVASMYSDAYADVQKTTGMTKNEVKGLTDQLAQLDSRTSLKDLLNISGVAGQFGVAKDQVYSFTDSIDKLAISFEGELPNGAEGVATTFSKLRNVMTDIKSKDIGSDMLRIGNAFNILSSAGNATSAGLANFSNRIGGIGISLGLNSSQVLGFSSTLEELNISAERGSTALTGTLQKMASSPEKFAKLAGMGVNEFKTLINTDLYGAFKKVTEATKGFSATELASTLKSLGLNGSGASEVFAKLANNTALLDERTQQASDALQNQNSILSEFNTKNTTLAAEQAKSLKLVEMAFLNFGEAIEPIMIPITKVFNSVTKLTADFIKTDFAPFITSFQNSFNNFLPALGGIWQGIKDFGNELLGLFSPMVTFLSNELGMIGESISKAFGIDKNKSIHDLIGSGKSMIDSFLNPLRIALNFAKIGFNALQPIISFLSGTVQGLISNFDWVANSFQYVKDSLQPLFNLFQETGKETQGFSIAGQILGKVLSGVLSTGFYILGNAIQFTVGIITTLKSMIDFVLEGLQKLFSFADKLSGGVLSKGLESFTSGLKNLGGQLGINFGADNKKSDLSAQPNQSNEQLSRILSTLGSGQNINQNDLQTALKPILSSGTLNTDSQKILSQIANSTQLKGTPLGLDLNNEIGKLSGIGVMPNGLQTPLNDPQGVNKVATQMTDMKSGSSQAMANFENNTVKNKQAETLARTPAPVPQNINVQSTVTSTPVNFYIEKEKIGGIVIDYLSDRANN